MPTMAEWKKQKQQRNSSTAVCACECLHACCNFCIKCCCTGIILFVLLLFANASSITCDGGACSAGSFSWEWQTGYATSPPTSQHLDVLQLESGYTEKELKAAWHRYAVKYHTDKCDSREIPCEDFFLRGKTAYDELKKLLPNAKQDNSFSKKRRGRSKRKRRRGWS